MIWKISCEIYSRVVGYFRPVKDWNIGKQQEFKDRKPYDIEKIRLFVKEEKTVQGKDERQE